MTEEIGTLDSIGKARWLAVLPAVFIAYLISYFDRLNVAMALPHMAKDLHLTSVQAGWIAAVFAWGYAVTGIGGGYLALKFGPRRLIPVCLLLFGAAAMLSGGATTFLQMVAVRVLLGMAEGPINLSATLLLTQWFMKPERGRALGIFNLGAPVGALLAGPVSGILIAHFGWRVMLVAEGLPAWVLCLAWFKAIPESLDTAGWLSASDRHALKQNLEAEQAQYVKPKVDRWWTIFGEPAGWWLALGFGLAMILLYGTTLWLPTIMKSYGTLSDTEIGFLSGAPFAMSMLGIYYITRRSDKHGQERRLHAAVPTMATGILIILAALVPARLYFLQIALIIGSGFTVKMLLPLHEARFMEIFPLKKAVLAAAIFGGMGNLFGQFCGPLLVGYVRAMSPNFQPSLLILGVCGILGGLAIAASKTKAERLAANKGRLQYVEALSLEKE